MNFTIRKIQKKDEPAVADVIRIVMSSYDCAGEGYSIEDPEVDSMYDYYNNPESAFYIVEDTEGVIQGCGGIGPLTGADEAICELRKMYFYPSLRGHGFGKKMVELCIETARDLGYQKMYLETLDRMKRANHLYAKMGFEKLPNTLGNTGHSQCDAYYAKDLKQEI